MTQIPSARLKNNNFDLLRLLFAATVCLVHAYQLSGFQQLAGMASLLSSSLAVKAFFVVSGFLIFMSYERSSSFSSYAAKRAKRIYPAYCAVILFSAVGLLWVSTAKPSSYFTLEFARYMAANLTFLNFLQPTLPGVFTAHQTSSINGALWTLKVEVMFYLVVPVFVACFRRVGHLPVLVLVYCASVWYALAFMSIAERTGVQLYAEFARQLPGQLSYFMSGAFLYYYLPLFERRTAYFLAAATAILIENSFYPLPLFAPFALATVVIFFGLFLYVGKFGKYGDFSYGAYILHFPVIQILLNTGSFAGKPWTFLATVVGITAVGAVAMWHLVEKHFLHRTKTSTPTERLHVAAAS